MGAPSGRILVTSALSLGQTVFIADAGHKVLKASNPGASFFSCTWHQVKRLHVLAIVDAEAAVGIKATVGIPLEDLRLLPLTHLPNGVDWDCEEKKKHCNRDWEVKERDDIYDVILRCSLTFYFPPSCKILKETSSRINNPMLQMCVMKSLKNRLCKWEEQMATSN